MTTTFKALRAAVCVTAISLSATAIHAQNLLIDPSFENQTAATDGGWSLFNGAAFSNAQARTGAESMLDAGPAGFAVPGSFETFAATPGQQFELTGYGLTSTAIMPSASDFGILQITFFDGANGSGNNLGSINVSAGGTPTGAGNAQASGSINSASPLNQWIFLDTGIAQAPAGSQSAEAFTLVLDGDATAVYFDDLSLVQVTPEPTTMALLGLSLLAVPALRRRK